MIVGKQRRELSKESILSLISEWQIYKWYISELVSVGKPFCNSLRGESNPSMSVDLLDIGLRHLDRGNDYYRGDCFDYIKQKYGCDFHTALLHVNKDFGLGLVAGKSKIANTVVVRMDIPKEEVVKKNHIIRVKTRKFNIEELQWWGKYKIGVEDLKNNYIYAPKEIIRDNIRIPLTQITFCYFYPKIEKWKLYRPNGGKETNNTPLWMWKWDSNVPHIYVSYLEQIKGCEKAFLTKSRKDRMVLSRLLNSNCIAVVESESQFCVTQSVIDIFKKNSEKQYIVSDSDEAGKKFSWWLTREHGFKHLNTPDALLRENINDFAGWVNKYGDQPALEYLKSKNLIL